MHIARAIEQDIHWPGGLCGSGNGLIIQHIQRRGRDAWGGKLGEQRWVAVCRDHPRAFGGHGKGGGPPNSLARSGHETKLACQSACHHIFLR